jgi:hypothetical protein
MVSSFFMLNEIHGCCLRGTPTVSSNRGLDDSPHSHTRSRIKGKVEPKLGVFMWLIIMGGMNVMVSISTCKILDLCWLDSIAKLSLFVMVSCLGGSW